MRIIHVLSAPAAGGAEIYVMDLCRRLAAEGNDVMVVFVGGAEEIGRCIEFEQRFITSLQSCGVATFVMPSGSRRNMIVARRHLLRTVRSWNADVVHVHLYQGLAASYKARVPVVYTHHSLGSRIPRWLFRMLEHRALGAVVGICYACTKFLQEFSSKPVVRIDNAVDPKRIAGAKENTHEYPFVVLAVGRLIPLKNYKLLVESMSLLRGSDIVLRIAGEGPLRGELEALAISLGVEAQVEFLGHVDDVSAIMARADILAICSDQEGLPITLLESVLAGLPAVVRNVGGCAEVVHATLGGLVIDEANPQTFADAIRMIYDDPDLLHWLCLNLKKNSSRYEIDGAAKRHLELYTRLVTNDSLGEMV